MFDFLLSTPLLTLSTNAWKDQFVNYKWFRFDGSKRKQNCDSYVYFNKEEKRMLNSLFFPTLGLIKMLRRASLTLYIKLHL